MIQDVPQTADMPGDRSVLAQCKRRIELAKMDRNRHQRRLDEIYRYTMPWRARIDQNVPSAEEVDDVYDATGIEAVADFAADMLMTFTPLSQQWVKVEPARSLSLADQRVIEADAAKYVEIVFEEIRRSNFYAEVRTCYRDLAAGTMAMIIQDIDASRPIQCEAVAAPTLIIDRGPWGDIDGKWREIKVRAQEIKIKWPKAQLSDKLRDLAKNSPFYEVIVTEGLYRQWDNKDDQSYRFVVFVDDHVLIDERLDGEDACPMTVARWDTDAETAWGIGPAYLALPDIKTASALARLVLQNLNLAVNPPGVFDDDGTFNLSQGIEPGMWYPRVQGSKVETIDSKARFDVGYYQKDELRKAIRRALFQDKPDQPGKTPPTATQWLQEATEMARRMGAPLGNLIGEWQYPIFRRFAWLLAKRGTLAEVKLDGQFVALAPVSPLMKAAKQEEAMRIAQFVQQIAGSFGPQAAMVLLNIFEVADAVRQGMELPPNLLNPQQQVIGALQQAAGMAQQAGMLPGGGAAK